MSHFSDVRAVSTRPPAGSARGVVRWLCTSNPFYVISAVLFLIGLRVSFGSQVEDVRVGALMSGLAGYTLLLAVTACLLVRFANVWDDVRTVLLLVVFMFLVTSLTFDEVLVVNPGRGCFFCLAGLLLAVAVSEGILHGIRLRLPAGLRLPYYLLLGLFFLYPVALSPLVPSPRAEATLWGLFGFSAAAGLAFLTLVPAARRGPAYVRDNGSPWRWPLYPWVLFGVLGFFVPVRAFLLCWTLHLVPASDGGGMIFGPYFLVPFAMAVAVLMLEAGLTGRRKATLGMALALPPVLIGLAVAGHRHDPVYRGFLEVFTARLGATPLYLTLLASTAFYGYAALRRVPLAAEALTAVVAAFAFVSPNSLRWDEVVPARPTPLLAAAALQLIIGACRRSSWRCLLATAGLVAVIALALPEKAAPPAARVLFIFHLGLFAVLIVGGIFRDDFARFLRFAGSAVAFVCALAALFGDLELPPGLPRWQVEAYPLVLTAILAGYGRLLGHRPALFLGGLALACWLTTVSWQGYCALREVVTGLDFLVLSLALFGLAVLISLGKSGLLSRWLALVQGRVSQSAG